ncbi:MAG TPA: PDZ domain-containing protein [Planctomycetota bacterium]|nr:PDZ domain-containing protein [Planctomycetota bacterium]
MKSVAAFLLSLAVAAPALAQDPDKDSLKRDLLKEVEKRLKAEDERLLKDIEKVIEEELNKSGKAPKATPKAEPRAETPKAEGPKRKVRGFLGVKLMDLTDEDKKDLGVKSGLKVAEVVEGGPAAKGGLQTGDVITAVDGRPIDSMQELAPIMAAAGPGTSVKVDVIRDGKKKTMTIVLAPHPADLQPAEPPKEQGKGEDDLRERVKKFLEKKEAPKDDSKPKAKKPAPAPKDDDSVDELLAFDEDTFDQFKEMFEKFGVDPEQFFEKGKDGKYRLNDQMKEMFKNFNFDRFKNLLPKDADPDDLPAPAPKKAEPRKTEPKKPEPRASRPWLGLQPEDLPDELRAQLDLAEGEGLLVTQVMPGSPAEQAGLKKNDILTKIDGKPVKGEESLAAFMSGAKPGQEATLTVLRKSKEQKIKVTVGEKKE